MPRIASIYGASFGRSAMTTTSTLTIVEATIANDGSGARQQIDARSTAKLRVRVGKVAADVTGGDRPQHGIGDRVAHRIRIGVAEQTSLVRHGHPAKDQRPPLDQSVEIVAGPDPDRADA